MVYNSLEGFNERKNEKQLSILPIFEYIFGFSFLLVVVYFTELTK